MTSVTYNGVVLKNVLTEKFVERCAYDSSDTDLVHHEYTIRVQGLVHDNTSGSAVVVPPVPPAGTDKAADFYTTIDVALLQPRGDFEYSAGGVVLRADSRKGSPHRDVDNGPKPKVCEIVHIAGDRVFRVTFEIQVALVRSQQGRPPGPATSMADSRQNQYRKEVLSNRWSTEETLDDAFVNTRYWRGVLRVRSADVGAHLLRSLVVPPLLPGYRRERMHFLSTPDGLNLQYTVADRRMHAAPPPPAVKWSGTCTESTGKTGGLGYADVSVRLEGRPDVDKRALLETAIAVVEARTGHLAAGSISASMAGSGRAKPVQIESAAFIEHFAEPIVEARVRVLRVPEQKEYLNLDTRRIGLPLDAGGATERLPGYDHTLAPAPPLFSSGSPAGIFATYLQSPAIDRHEFVKASGANMPGEPVKRATGPGGAKPGGFSPIIIRRQVPEIIENHLSDQQANRGKQGNPYTCVEAKSHYDTRTGAIGLPIAATSTSGNADTAAVVRVHPSVAVRTYRLIAERLGDWPDLPEPEEIKKDANGITETLIQQHVMPTMPELTAGGKTYRYRVEAKYVYQLSRPPTTREKLRAGSSPIDDSMPNNNFFNQAKHLTRNKIEHY